MSQVGSLLVRDHVLSLQQMEAALHRQRIDGGELESVLLDMALVPENVLNAYRAAVYDLFPATREELRVDHSLGAPLSTKQWSVLRALPFYEESNRLTIAVAEPMDPSIVARLERDTNKSIVQRIVTSIRLNIALSQWAQLELTARDDRLARKIATQTAGVTPFVSPPSSRLSYEDVPKTGRRQRVETLADTPTSSNDPLKILLRSAARDFEYVALFEAKGELACGVDALGSGTASDTIVGIAIPLDIPSAFADAIASHAVTELGSESLDILIRKDLGRAESTSAVIIPLGHGERQFLLYADRTEQAGTTHISALHQARTEFEESHVRGLPVGVSQNEVAAQEAPTTLQQAAPHPGVASVLHIPHTAPPPPSLREVRGAALRKNRESNEDWLALVMRSDGPLDETTRLALRADAPGCITVLGEVFPGKLRSDLNLADLTLPAARLSPVCQALAMLALDHGQEVADVLSVQLEEKCEKKRLCAVRLCDALRIHSVRTRVSLWSAVARQLDSEDSSLQRAAFVALRNRVLHAPLELPELSTRHAALRVSNANEAGLEGALAFVEKVRDPGALPALFNLLSDPTHQSRAKQLASTITGMDLGRDSSRWRVWYGQNVGVPRFFWLVEALDCPDIAMRAFAADELESYVGDALGYSPTAPKEQRMKGQQAFIEWHAAPMQNSGLTRL